MSQNLFRGRGVSGWFLLLVVVATVSSAIGALAEESVPAVPPAPVASPGALSPPSPGPDGRPAVPTVGGQPAVPVAPIAPPAPAATEPPITEAAAPAEPDVPPAVRAQGDVSPAAHIRAALGRKVHGEFVEAPLTDVLDYAADVIGVSMVRDQRAIEALGVDVAQPVSLTVKDVPARSLLSLVLEPLGLQAVVHRDVLLVTSAERAETLRATRVYDVSDLVAERSPNAELGGARVATVPIAPARVRLDELADMITRSVEPDSWDQAGGAGVVVPLELHGAHVLVVRQTQSVHDELESLLAEMRRLVARHGMVPVGAPPGAAEGPAEPSLPGPTLQPRQSPPSAPAPLGSEQPVPVPPVPPPPVPAPPAPSPVSSGVVPQPVPYASAMGSKPIASIIR